jgi:hypothetical protein
MFDIATIKNIMDKTGYTKNQILKVLSKFMDLDLYEQELIINGFIKLRDITRQKDYITIDKKQLLNKILQVLTEAENYNTKITEKVDTTR